MSTLQKYTNTIQQKHYRKRLGVFLVASLLVMTSTAAVLGHLFFAPTFADDTITSQDLSSLGVTPQAVTGSQDGTHIVISTTDFDNQFYVSNDSGATWTPVSVLTGSQVGSKMMVSSANGQNIYGVAGNRWARSTNGGMSWTRGATTGFGWTSLSYSSVTDKLYAVNNLNATQQGIYVSSDFGVSWTLLTATDNDLVSVSVSRDGTILYDTYYLEDEGYTETNVSTDNGQTWTQIHHGDTTTFDDEKVYANGDNSLIIISQFDFVANDDAAPLISTDGGQTWTRSQGPILHYPNDPYMTDPLTYNFLLDTTLYAVAVSQSSTPPPVTPTAGTGDQTLADGNTISAQPTFTGTSQPLAQITVTVHSDPVTCTATADADGNWSCQLPQALPSGSHTVQIDVVNPDSSTDQLGPYTVSVPTVTETTTPPPTTPAQPTKGRTIAENVASEPSSVDTTTVTVAADPTSSDDQSPVVTDTTTQAVDTTGTVTKSNGIAWWWYVVAGVAAIIIIIVIVVIRRARIASFL